MKKLLLALLLMVPVASATTLAATPASAAPTTAQAAREVSLEAVFGSKYGYYKTHKPYSKTLDWRTNGCTIPIPSAVTAYYRAVFAKSCDRHDFGYRNHDKSGLSRKTIDDRLHSNMDAQCKARYTHAWEAPARAVCFKASDAMYAGVRKLGGWFY